MDSVLVTLCWLSLDQRRITKRASLLQVLGGRFLLGMGIDGMLLDGQGVNKVGEVSRSVLKHSVSSAKPTAKLMVETMLLRQTLASHAVLFLTAPREEGKLLGAQSEGAGSPSVSGGASGGGLHLAQGTPGAPPSPRPRLSFQRNSCHRPHHCCRQGREERHLRRERGGCSPGSHKLGPDARQSLSGLGPTCRGVSSLGFITELSLSRLVLHISAG